MNKQKFVEYLRNPNELNAQTLAQLESVIEEHPYFQCARTLLAKGSKQLNPKKAGHLINSAAIYATDRILLKRYINDELIFLSPFEVHESHEADHDRDIKEVIKSNKIASAQAKAARESEVAPKKQRIIPPKEEPVEKLGEAPDPSELDFLIDDIYKEMEALKVNRAKLNEIENKLAEDEAVDDAVKRATEKVASKIEERQTEKPPETKETPKQEIVTQEDEPVEATTDISEPEKEEKEIEDVKEDEPQVQTENVKEAPTSPAHPKEEEKKEPEKEKKEGPKSSEKQPEKKEEPKDEHKDDVVILKKPSLSRSARVRKLDPKPSGEQKPENKESLPKSEPKTSSGDESESNDDKADSHRRSQSEIIANFIKNNPTISPADSSSKSKNDADLSSKSTELHPEIASEYLAEIYLKQGLKKRAVQIYEALIVKFPEKSVYFADIIKKINEES